MGDEWQAQGYWDYAQAQNYASAQQQYHEAYWQQQQQQQTYPTAQGQYYYAPPLSQQQLGQVYSYGNSAAASSTYANVAAPSSAPSSVHQDYQHRWPPVQAAVEKPKKKKKSEPVPEKQWPPSLRKFVEKVFSVSRSSSEREKASSWLKDVVASAKEQGILWSKDWAREKIPNLTPSSTPVTCPVCLTVFTPSRQTDASGCLTKARKFSEALGSAASTAGGGALELALENSFTPEAVAGKWLSVHGCMKWDDWVHERCLETLAGKAKEFQKASGLKYPEIASNKWRELQRWCLHVVQTSQLPPAQTKSKTPKKKEFQTISPISSPPKKKKKKNPSTTNNVFNDSEEDDLRKKMKRAERFQVKAGKKLNKRTHVFHARAAEAEGIVGRCETMCPLAELEKRFWTNDFDELELPSPDFPGMAVEDLAVKRFARTITEEDRQPDRLRTRDTLKRTMNHLLSLMDSKRTTLEKVHRFLWDRFRAIRTDLSIQDIKDTFAVRCYEEMIRFHIIAEHELCEETATVNNPHGFNSHLNVEQMYKCLTSLFSLYDDLAKEGTSCPNEPEFRAYHILLTMDTHGKYRRDKSAHSFALSKTRPEILHSPFVRFAVQLNGLYHDGNYVKFFSVVRKTSFLISCILHAYFDPVRARAIKLLSQGVYGRSGTLPTSDIQEMLLMDNAKDVISLCRSYGLQVQKGKEGAGVAVGQNNFQEITEAVLRKCSKFISSKRSNTKYSDCCVKASTFTQQ